jgi:hypothetical protein
MNINDEELQRNIESGNDPGGDELDVKAYQEIFSRLRKSPDVNLSADFVDRIIVKIEAKQKRSASRDFYWLGLGVLLLFVALVVASVMTGFKPTLGFLKGMSAYAGVFAFGVAFILFLNRLDKKLLPKQE